MGKCKMGYALNEDGTIPQRCHVDWDGKFYPTVCKECPFYHKECEVMTEQNLKQLSFLLGEYYKEQSKTCDYNCYNCELGVISGYGDMHSCAIEMVQDMVDEELYRMK